MLMHIEKQNFQKILYIGHIHSHLLLLMVVFSRFCSRYDIRELFCTALGIPRESVPALSVLDRNTTMSLLDSTGAMVSIDPTMPHNTERSPYSMVPLTGGQLAGES
nr:high affinity cGMP-specific 3',5'-cyclic phosphodiesterase 9A-like isoform X1 [Salvelinus alpinus]